MNRRSGTFLAISVVVAFAAVPRSAYAQSAPTADAEVARLIERLGSGSHAERVQSTERLISVGPQAKDALLKAAGDDDFEIALRARRLLKLMDELLFAGVAVELQASKTSIAWSDEVALELRLRSTTDHAARLPFEAPPASNSPQDRLAQVSALLDLADFLVVTNSDGRIIPLHVDDIGEDQRLVAAVNRRVDDPPGTTLPSRSACVYRFERFNRGWARYRLLRGGAYRVQFVYQPEWDDPEMRNAGVGRVASEPVTITVTEPAPENVCRSHRAASLAIAVAGAEFVATLTNHDDMPVWVNLNIASRRPPPFGDLRWSVERKGKVEELSDGVGSAVPIFSRDRLRELAPGASIEIGRLPRASATPLVDCEIVAAHTNLTSRAWQIQSAESLAGHPKTLQALKKALPDRILTTALRARIPCDSAAPPSE